MDGKIIIKLVQEYNHRKLAESRFSEELIEKLKQENKLVNYKNIELDISGCRVGYPATPRFIDYFLNHLSKQEGNKSFTIKMNAIANFEWIFLNILVLEGDFFSIKKKMNSEEDLIDNKKQVNEKLIQNNITFNVVVNNFTEYKYGDKE
jgi:glutaredoxin 2